MPTRMRSRVPPSFLESGTPSIRAASSQAPISTAALAMLWPRKLRSSAGEISSGPAKVWPSTRGATHSRMACQAVSIVSGP